MEGIVEPVISGDTDLVVHRMARHLDATVAAVP